MKAAVKVINPKRGMYAAETENGEFVIFELLDSDEPEVGDIVTHSDFYSMGGEEYRNATQKVTISVYVENVVGSLEQARKQCFLQ
jgi:hypothetical protein